MCITVVCPIPVPPSELEMHWSAAEPIKWKEKTEGYLYSLGPMCKGMGSVGLLCNTSWKLNEQLMIARHFEFVECNLLPKVALWRGKWSSDSVHSLTFLRTILQTKRIMKGRLFTERGIICCRAAQQHQKGHPLHVHSVLE